MSAPAQRMQLRQELREREKRTIPELKRAVREARKSRAKKLKLCQKVTAKRRALIARAAGKARLELSARLKRTGQLANETARLCRASSRADALDKIDKALLGLVDEREALQRLRAKASAIRSDRGAAGGRRTAIVRTESDDEVRRNIDDDATILAVWQKVKSKIKPTEYSNRTEVFLDWLHNHPEALREEQARTEPPEWESEAEHALRQYEEKRREVKRAGNEQRWLKEVDQADAVLQRLSDDDNVPF